MKRVLFSLLLLLAAVSETSVMAAPTPAFPWLIDLDRARATAAEQHKPLLIVFRCQP